MAKIQSGATADELTIDPTSKAARTTLYDSDGTELVRVPTGSYTAPLANLGRFSGALAAGNPFWALRNGATKTLYIRRILFILAFDGTAAATTFHVELRRFTAATHSTGTAITPQPKRTTYATTVADIRNRVDGTKLTDTSVVYDTNPFLAVANPRGVSSAVTVADCQFSNPLESFDCLEVPASAGLVLWAVTASVIGDSCQGFIEWDEA